MVAPSSKFYGKIWVGFCLNTGKCLRDFILTPTERAQVILKKSTRDFQNRSLFERSPCFFVTISENFKRFNTLTLKQTFWKTKTFFKKLEGIFLDEATKIENTSLPFKTALSKANVKTNRMVTTKWTYHREWSFANNYLIFLENLFQFQNPLKRVNFMYQRPKC